MEEINVHSLLSHFHSSVLLLHLPRNLTDLPDPQLLIRSFVSHQSVHRL